MKKFLFINGLLFVAAMSAFGQLAHLAVSPGDTICAGTALTFTATVTGGTGTSFTWLKNGVYITTTAVNTYTSTATSGDVFSCSVGGVLTSGANFYAAQSNSDTIVNALTVNVPTISITGNTSVLPGHTVTLNATVANAGPTYVVRWMNKGVLFATTSVPTVTYTKGTGPDTITAKAVSISNGCYDSTTSAMYYVRDMTGVSLLTGQSLSVSIYPNPARHLFTISAVAAINNVVITNMVGQTMSVNSYHNGERAVQQNIEGLAAGIYLVHVQCGEERYVGKMVVE